MIVDMLLAIGRFVDRLLGNRATTGRWSWPPLEDAGGPLRIDGERVDRLVPATARLSQHEADELAERDAQRLRRQREVWARYDAVTPEVLEPDRLAQKWCTYHGAWADPMGGAEVRSHIGPSAGCSWCCASCLARATVIGRIVLEQT